jgi:ATP-dependent Clp protease ATP-binding subunit ClpA
LANEDHGRAARAPLDEAIRRHLRPELVNRLTRIVHFKPLGMETVREILGKLIAEALLGGKITAGQALRAVAEGESLRFLPQ